VAFLKDPGEGFHIFEDFFSTRISSNSQWYSYLDAGGQFVLDDDEDGVLELSPGDTDNEAVTIISGDNTTGIITPTDRGQNKWWFEARVKWDTITDGAIAAFIGLTEEGQAASAKPMADDGIHAINDIDHVGFHVDGADGDGLNLVWSLFGQTAQSTIDVQTLVADTFYRLGLKFNPIDNKVHVYIDGIENTSAAFSMSHVSAPADTLAVCLSVKADVNAISGDGIHVDWVRYAAERDRES
jgi:hypothetical protein